MSVQYIYRPTAVLVIFFIVAASHRSLNTQKWTSRTFSFIAQPAVWKHWWPKGGFNWTEN